MRKTSPVGRGLMTLVLLISLLASSGVVPVTARNSAVETATLRENGILAVATDYTWSQSTGAYTEITGGTVHGTASNDDTSFNAVSLGFTFNYNGVDYTQVSIQSNGFAAMGATVSNSYTPLSSGATNNVLSALGRDLQGNGTTSELMSKLEGTAPNRVFTIQWKHYKRYGTAYAGDSFNFQIKLYETTNVVEYVYGPFTAVSVTTPPTIQVGLRGASNADFNNRTSTGDWTASTAGATNTANMALTNVFFPPSGLTWTWTPIPPSPNFGTSYKSAPAQVLLGDTVTYTVRIINSGAAPANAATMVDPIPASVTYNNDVACSAGMCGYDGTNVTWAGTVGIGASVAITFSVDTDGAPCGVLVNEATLDDPGLFAGAVVKSASTMLTASSPTPLDGFEVSVPPPGWTETIVNDPGTDPDWTQESIGANPTISPRSGGYMAKFNSYNAPANASSRLWTDALDLSGYAAPQVVFWMSHDTGFPGNADRVQIQVSTDGVTWVDVGDPVLRYDATCTTPCWKEHGVVLPAGYDVNGVYIGFLGISAFGNNFYLDDTALAEAWYPCPYVSLGPDAAQSVCAGSSAEYSLILDNFTEQTTTFDVTVAGNAWTTTPNPVQVTLAPGESGAIAVTVNVPWAGGADTATVTATGGGYSDSATLATSDAPGGLVPEPWESIATINSTGRSRPATAAVDGKIYLFGGEISGSPNRAATVEMFDPTAGVWVDMTGLMPIPASNICAAAIGDDIYIPGGSDTAAVYLDTLQVYNTTSDTWQTIATDPLPEAKLGHGCAAVDGKLYIYGGQTTGGVYSNSAHVYDPAAAAGSRWTALPNMSTTRGFLAGAAVNGKVYAVGGRDGVTANFAYVEAFDPADGLWHTVTAMSTARGGPGAMVAGDLLIACGGGWTTYLNTCEAYDTTLGYAGVWETLSTTMIQGRRTYGYASLPEAIYAVAGWNGAYLTTAERMPVVACEAPNPAITLSKTVGTDPLVCATTDEITVPAGTDVTYCYEVTNTGNVTLNLHDLDDSELGNLLSGLSYALAPGASAFVTETATINVTTVNTATWTAYNGSPTAPSDLVHATDVATVTVSISSNPSISLNKTVGTVPGVCALTDDITITAGTEVYYCYVVENTGDVTFNFHDLVDSELGVILNDFPYTLAPGAFSPQVIVPATPMASVTNVATWTAVTALGEYMVDDTIPFNWQDISGTGTAVSLTDDSVSGALPIGFSFEYYGTIYSDVYASSNGFITVLPGQPNGCCTGGILPSTTTPNGVIAGWWEDLSPNLGGTIHYETLGTAPNRVFIVQYTDIPHYPGGNEVTKQYKLFEGTNTIEVHYQAAPSDGGTHSAGIENAAGTLGIQYYRGTASLPTPLAVRYYLTTVESASDTDTATVTVLAPNIDVDPLSYNVLHAAPQVTTAPLTIANTGQGDLVWNIAEEPTRVQPAPLAGGDVAVAAEVVDASDFKVPEQAGAAAPLSAWRTPEAVLYDNGPLVTHPGAGAGGADVSAVQTAIGLGSWGFGNQLSAGNRIADDFTVTGGGWLVDTITFFAYQTGSSTTSTINHINLRIWDGPPNDPGSNVVFGDTTTNRLASTTWTNIYRTLDTELGFTNRPVMTVVANVNTFLPAGTYWVDWQVGGTLASGPWAPAISILGQATTGNALQFTSTGWATLVDGAFPQGFPFIIEGVADCSDLADVPWLSVSPANGVNAGGTSTVGTVTFDSTALTAGTYTANLCVFSNDPDIGPGNGTGLVIVPVELVVEEPPVEPSIVLTKTVGTVDGVCAGTSEITVPEGTTVYYCYTVTNTGDVTLTLHDLVDDQLGTIFTVLSYALTPGSSVNTVQAGLSIPAVINATTTNVATWTAYIGDGPSAMATATATVNVEPTAVSVTRLAASPAGGWSSVALLGVFALGGFTWKRKRR